MYRAHVDEGDRLMRRAIELRGQSSARRLLIRAEERYRIAMEDRPYGVEANVGLAHTLWERSNYAEGVEGFDLIGSACQLLKEAYRRRPYDPSLAIDVAGAHLDFLEAHPDPPLSTVEAVRLFIDDARLKAPGDARVLVLAARLVEITWTRDGDRDSAAARFLELETRFAEAHRKEPENAEILHQWGCTLVQAAAREADAGRQDGLRVEACERLRAALKADDRRAVSWAWLMRALFERGDNEAEGPIRDRLLRDAEAAGRRLLELSPGYAGARDNLALVLRAKRDG